LTRVFWTLRSESAENAFRRATPRALLLDGLGQQALFDPERMTAARLVLHVEAQITRLATREVR
jgi:hypothetical protein